MIRVDARHQPIHGGAYHAFSYCSQDRSKQYSRYHLILHGIAGLYGQRAKRYLLSLLCNSSTYASVALVALEAEYDYGSLPMHVSEHGVYGRGLVLLPSLALFDNKHVCAQSHALSSLLYTVSDMLSYDLCYRHSIVSSLQASALYFLRSTLHGSHEDDLYETQHISLIFLFLVLDETLYNPCVFYVSLLCLLGSVAFCIRSYTPCITSEDRLYGSCFWRSNQGLQEKTVGKDPRIACVVHYLGVYCSYGEISLSSSRLGMLEHRSGKTLLPHHFTINQPIEQLYGLLLCLAFRKRCITGNYSKTGPFTTNAAPGIDAGLKGRSFSR